MKAFVFPGQGSQFSGMGKDLYNDHPKSKSLFEQANDILGFNITDIMFNGSADDLKQTKVTQPAVFLHSVITAKALNTDVKPDMVAGHSLGEFSALVVNGTLSFKDGLKLVSARALAMQKACEKTPSTMAAIIGMEDDKVAEICKEISEEVVVPANFNCPGQIVISGSIKGIDIAMEKLQKAGAKKMVKLPVGGAFHSPLMEPAKIELEAAINNTEFQVPNCPVYQNVNSKPSSNPTEIKKNLILQLTGAVLWTQTVQKMVTDGCLSFAELGPGKVLQGLIKKIDRSVEVLDLT